MKDYKRLGRVHLIDVNHCKVLRYPLLLQVLVGRYSIIVVI